MLAFILLGQLLLASAAVQEPEQRQPSKQKEDERAAAEEAKPQASFGSSSLSARGKLPSTLY